MNNDLEQFSDLDLEGMAHGNNPVANAYRELLAFRMAANQAKPVAFTGSGSLSAIKVGHEGYIWGTSAEAHPIELYTTPQPDHTEQSEMLNKAHSLSKSIGELRKQIDSSGGYDFEAQRSEQMNSPVIPDGWKLVPIEPTYEMKLQVHPIAVGTCHNCGCEVNPDCEDNVLLSWQDMLAAAPKPESE